MPFTLCLTLEEKRITENAKTGRGITLHSDIHYTLVQAFSSKTDLLNAHPLLELYTHSVSLFQHDLFFPKSKDRGKPPDIEFSAFEEDSLHGHIESMYNALCIDWVQLVFKNWLIYNNKVSCNSEHTLTPLRNLLFSD